MIRSLWILQVVVWPLLAVAADPEAPKAAPKPAEKPKLAVTISKETTFLTEPLGADGYPDYDLVLERELRKGATAKNNAVVLLMRALGSELGDDDEADDIYEKLDIEPLETDKLNYFEKWQDYVERLPEDKLPPPTKEQENDPQLNGTTEYDGQVRLRIQQPQFAWKRAEYPQMSAWLDQNAAPLDKLREIGKHTHFYSPKFRGNLFSYTQLMEYSTAIARRALRDAGEERWDAAWAQVNDLLTLAQRFNQVPDRFEQEAAAELFRIGFQTANAIMIDPRIDATRLKRWREDIDQRTIASTQRCCGWHDRLLELRQLVKLAKSDKRPDTIAWVNPPWHLAYTLQEAYDFDQALKQINKHFDRIDQGYQDLQNGKPTRFQSELNVENFEFFQFMRNPLAQLGMLKATKEQRTEILVKLRLPHPQYTVMDTIEHEYTSRAWWDLTRLHLALELYRREHGKYPAELSAMTPKLLEKIPLDHFTDEKPYQYRTSGKGFLLYSLGPDGKDSTGNNTLDNVLRYDRLDDQTIFTPDHRPQYLRAEPRR